MLDNDCVIVPGLGGFMAHHVEARYAEGECLFLPPLRTIGFNAQLKLNDSLLAQSYVETYDISYPEAVRRIESEVSELRQHLENEGCYELNDIGTLSLNDEGNIIFEPCEAGILTPSLYGLSSFEMPTRNASAKPTKTDNSASEPVKDAGSEVSGDKQEATKSTEDEADDVVRIKTAWIRNAVAAAAAVIAFFLFATPITNSTSDTSLQHGDLSGNVTARLAPSKKAIAVTSSQSKGTLSARTSTQDTVKVALKTPIKKDTVKAERNKFCIVMASQVARSGANDLVKRMKANGYDDTSVYEHNKIIRVVYGHYATETEAYDTLRKLRNNYLFEQSWVYKRR